MCTICSFWIACQIFKMLMCLLWTQFHVKLNAELISTWERLLSCKIKFWTVIYWQRKAFLVSFVSSNDKTDPDCPLFSTFCSTPLSMIWIKKKLLVFIQIKLYSLVLHNYELNPMPVVSKAWRRTESCLVVTIPADSLVSLKYNRLYWNFNLPKTYEANGTALSAKNKKPLKLRP